MSAIMIFCLAFSVSAFAKEISKLEGFVTNVDGVVYPSTNYYFNFENESYRIEDFTKLQTFSINDNLLFIKVGDQSEVKVGQINLDLSSLQNRVMTRFSLVENVEVETFYLNKKLPKINFELSCGVLGCRIVKNVVERTVRILSLKIQNGEEFCYYQNVPNRQIGVLYPEHCQR